MGQHQLDERLIHFQELASPRELYVILVLFNYPTGAGKCSQVEDWVAFAHCFKSPFRGT